MASQSKVVWSDGLFVKPHHFQQQTRYLERMAERLANGAEAHNFGLKSLQIDEDLLQLGKLSIVEASGILPDGTVFDIPGQDMAPPIVDLSRNLTANEVIWLCLPLTTENGLEVQAYRDEGGDVGARYQAKETLLRDNSQLAGELASVQVASVRPVLLKDSDDLSNFARLAILKVIDSSAEGAILLDRDFLPTMLSISAGPTVRRFLTEINDGVIQRARGIAARIGKPDQSGIAEVADFMLLQALNRISPRLRHMVSLETLHPRLVYETLLDIVGDLSTFLTESRLTPELPVYDHRTPSTCWPPMIQTLRQLLSATLVANAVPIPHQRKLHGYVVAPVHDRELTNTSEFVLAIKANVPQERLQREFVAQAKAASIERIRELVEKQLPGIPMHLLPVAPRQLPYHANYSYFKLERNSNAWAHLEGSAGFAFHIAGEFPGLELQFWAIKGLST